MPNHQSKKTFVIDTNVFIHRPDSILSFRHSEVVIPLWVLEELDKLKTFSDERGRNARHAIRFIEERAKKGDLIQGVKIENEALLRVEMSFDKKLSSDLSLEKNDNKIILCALTLQKSWKEQNPEHEVFFVSKDINARVKARALGLRAIDYEMQKAYLSTLYSGYKTGVIEAKDADAMSGGVGLPWPEKLLDNQFLQLEVKGRDEELIARYRSDEDKIYPVELPLEGVMSIKPRNAQQTMALDLLLDDSVSLVTLVGKAGTGKTLLALAAAVDKVFSKKQYAKILATRPVMPLGKDIGYLPGDKDEKLSHWMKPLYDNLELIVSGNTKPEYKSVEVMINSKLIEIEAITYIRGRSLPKQFIIVDEAQNLTPHEIKTIISRAGDHTKVVLTGDPNQVDTPYLDSDSNGLTYLVEAFKGNPVFGHITFEKSERSQLAELAAELL